MKSAIIPLFIYCFVSNRWKISMAQATNGTDPASTTRMSPTKASTTTTTFPYICDEVGDKCKTNGGKYKFICDPDDVISDKTNISNALTNANNSPDFKTSKIYVMIVRKIIPAFDSVDKFSETLLLKWMYGASDSAPVGNCKDIGAVVVVKGSSMESPTLASAISIRDTEIRLLDAFGNTSDRIDPYGDRGAEESEIRRYLIDLLGRVNRHDVEPPAPESTHVSKYESRTTRSSMSLSIFTMAIGWGVVVIALLTGWCFSRRPKSSSNQQSQGSQTQTKKLSKKV